MQALPLGGQYERDVSLKLRRQIDLAVRLWYRWVEESSERAARLARADARPAWEDLVSWARWLLTSRCQQTATEALLGRSRDTTINMLTLMQGHAMRTVYPAMCNTEKRAWDELWATAFRKVSDLWTDEGRNKWCAAAAATRMAEARAQGGSAEEVEAAGKEASDAIRDAQGLPGPRDAAP